MVPLVGLEPTHLAVLDFESSASTNSTTGAHDAALPYKRKVPLAHRRLPVKPAPGLNLRVLALYWEKSSKAFCEALSVL
jgi:hypothetical protein